VILRSIPTAASNISFSSELPDEKEIFFAQKPSKPKIALVASIAWTLWNYRLALIQALEKAGYEVVLIAADDTSRQKLQKHSGAIFHPLRHIVRSSLSPFVNLQLLLEFYRCFRLVKPDVVLLFTIRPNTLGNFAAAALKIPAISTIEGMGISGSTSWWLRKLMQILYRAAFRSTRKVIFLNRDDLEEFTRKQLVPVAKTQLIPGPGIDIAHFSPRDKTEHKPWVTFLFVARLLSEKGIREFAAAARILKAKNSTAVFQVLGSTDSGNPTSINMAEITGWVNEGILQYVGFVDDVRPVIAEADVMVLPSYYREGVPRSVLEAMAMGKMVITTDSVGCRETVTEGLNGYLVPPKDVNALVEVMEKALALSASQRAAMGEKSRLKAQHEFADALVLPHYLSIIKTILAKVT